MTEENFIGCVAGEWSSMAAWIRINYVGLADGIWLTQSGSWQAFWILRDHTGKACRARKSFTGLFALARAATVVVRFKAVLTDCGADILIALIGAIDTSSPWSDEKVVDVVTVHSLRRSDRSFNLVSILRVDAPANESVVGALFGYKLSVASIALRDVSSPFSFADRQNFRLEFRLVTQSRVFCLLTVATANRRSAALLHLRAFQIVCAWTAAHDAGFWSGNNFVFTGASSGFLVLQRRWTANAVIVTRLHHAAVQRWTERFAWIAAA